MHRVIVTLGSYFSNQVVDASETAMHAKAKVTVNILSVGKECCLGITHESKSLDSLVM